MIYIIKTKIQNNKKLFENFLSLYLLQGTNYLLPLITFPYLSRVLGPDTFGLISFANAFIAYFTAVTDYGFNLSATRQIAIHKDDKVKVEEIFNSVLLIKFFLLLVCSLIFVVLVLNIPKFEKQSVLYYYTFGIVLGSVLFPTWFFQGMEDMKYITFLNFIMRLITTIGVFLLVKKESDYIIVQILNSSGSIFISIVAILLIKFKYQVRFKLENLSTLYFYLKDGLYIFYTSILTTLYNQSNIFILGIFTNNTVVGYFAIADKLRLVILTVLSPITTALYPHFSNLFKDKPAEYLKKHQAVFKVVTGFTCILFLSALFLKEELILIVAGKQFLPAVPIFGILIFSILINGIGHLYTTLFLIVKGDNKKVFRLFSYSLLTYFTGTLFLYLLDNVNQYSLSYVLILSELCVVLCALFYFIKWKREISLSFKMV